jgi:hypothetical protein
MNKAFILQAAKQALERKNKCRVVLGKVFSDS